MGEGKIVCSVLGVKPEGKGPLWRSCRKYEDNIKMDSKKLSDIVWTGFAWLKILINSSSL